MALAAEQAIVGRRIIVYQPVIVWSVVWLSTVAVALRLILAPVVNHTWDSQTWWNIFVDLGHAENFLEGIRRPYEQIQLLTLTTRAQRLGMYYEGWAYPPGMLYLYYPISKFAVWWDPSMSHHIIAAGSFAIPAPPLWFGLLQKSPNIVADMITGWLLWRLTGKTAAAWWYLFNPYVLLAGAWTFDSVMVMLILLAVYLQEKERPMAAGVVLALGAVVKMVPLFLLPAFIIYLIRRPHARLPPLLLFTAAFGFTVVLLCLPVATEVMYVLSFHSQRYGGNMCWQEILFFLASNVQTVDWEPMYLVISGQIGTILLPIGLVWTAVYLYRKELTLPQLCIGMMLGYLAFTKLVNEVYLLPVVALATVLVERFPDVTMRDFRAVFWTVPLLWAIVNVPFQAFFVNFAVSMEFVDADMVRILYYEYHRDGMKMLSVGLAIAGILCTILYIVALPVFTKGEPVARN